MSQIGAYVFAFTFIASFVHLTIEFLRTPFINPFIIFVPLALIALNFFLLFGEFVPQLNGATIYFRDYGIFGTMLRRPEPVGHGLYMAEVSMMSAYVPRDSRYVTKGFSALSAFLAKTKVVKVYGQETQFVEKSGMKIGASVPAPFEFRGSLDGEKSLDADYSDRAEITKLYHIIAQMETKVQSIATTSASESTKHRASLMDTIREFQNVVGELYDFNKGNREADLDRRRINNDRN